MEAVIEQRKESRTDLSWPVSVWLPTANRFFNGKSYNISKIGVYLTVPMTTPIQTGNIVELNFPRTTVLAEQKGQFARVKKGRVVRIERNNTLKDANIGVGIAFL